MNSRVSKNLTKRKKLQKRNTQKRNTQKRNTQKRNTQKRKSNRLGGKKKNICYIEPFYKLDKKSNTYIENYKIIDGSRIYYTKHFNISPNSKTILDEYKVSHPNKCVTFARLEDHLLNQYVKAFNHFKKHNNCKVGDKLSYKILVISNKMRLKFKRDFPHHQILVNNTYHCI